MQKILIGSPIRQSPKILSQFITSLSNLVSEYKEVSYYFIDDNQNSLSSQILLDFQNSKKDKVIIDKIKPIDTYLINDNYLINDITHYWNDNLIWKVANFKNKIIKYCLSENFDYLFLLDSDLILDIKTLDQLISRNKEIVSEIFWTKWTPDGIENPQVWMFDEYSFSTPKISQPEREKIFDELINIFKNPGLYKVGGLGACTLISKSALLKGVNFSPIYNLSFWGEDRHFCIRAAALGIELFVDTVFPAFHVYRESDYDILLEKQLPFILNTKTFVEISNYFIHDFYSFNYLNPKIFISELLLNSTYKDLFNKKYDQLFNYLKENKIISTVLNAKNITPDNDTKNDNKYIFEFTLILSKDNIEISKTFFCNLEFIDDSFDNCKSNFRISNIELIGNYTSNPLRKPIYGFTLEDLLMNNQRQYNEQTNKVTLSMIIKNEENNFLEKMLTHACKYIDNAVILDDGSNDNSISICQNILKDIPHKIISKEISTFKNEVELRKELWSETIKTNPDWILALDADEIFEDSIIDLMKKLLENPNIDYYAFRLYDMWDENHYREDSLWNSQSTYRVFLTRYQRNFSYEWLETPIHCGRLPNNLFSLVGCVCYSRIKHFGWSKENLRIAKYNRYITSDPIGQYGNLSQYKSILDENPNLIECTF